MRKKNTNVNDEYNYGEVAKYFLNSYLRLYLFAESTAAAAATTATQWKEIHKC